MRRVNFQVETHIVRCVNKSVSNSQICTKLEGCGNKLPLSELVGILIGGWGLATGQAVVCGWLLLCGCWVVALGHSGGYCVLVCGCQFIVCGWRLMSVGAGLLLMGFRCCLSFMDGRGGGVIIEAGGAACLWVVQVVCWHHQCFWVGG